MDKESDLCPDVQPFVPKFQRRDGMEDVDGSSFLTLPNPYTSDRRRNHGFLSPRQRPVTADGEPAPGGGRDKPVKNGFSSNRGNRGTTEGSAHPDRAKWDPQTKTSKRIIDPRSKERIMGKKSPDGLKRGPRSAPNSSGRHRAPQADQTAFEVKMADFPELAVKSPAIPVQTRVCWGPPSQELASTNKTLPVEKLSPVKHQPHQRPTGLKPESSPNLSGQAVVVPTQTEGSASVATSWANIASQPPKKAAPKENTVTSTQQEEEPSDKKKRKKKKKKPNGPGEETAEPEVPPEPPKFEDKGEFPDLGCAFFGPSKLTSSSNTAKLCNEGIQREGGVSQSDEVPAGKSPSSQMTKKGQKAEKVSGKKSKVPVQLDIGTMLEVLEKKQQSQKAKQDAKPLILSVGGALPVNLKQPSVQKKLPWQQDKVAHNPLDSTSPMVKKGKQREVPKAKKPTPLKRVILKEREERKQNRLLEERGLIPGQESKPATEEQSESSLTGGVSPPALRTEDQSEGDETNETSLTEPEGDGEREEGLEEESGELQPPPVLAQPAPNRPKIHSRKFRDYCSQVLSKDVDECVSTLLRELVRFQDRLYQKDPMRARMKRRLVMGLREVLKHLRLRKVKCVVISPNCERIQSKGGLDEALHTIIDTCREQGVPFVFALSRKALGRCVNKAVPVSLVGIFNYDGAQDFYHKMIELSSEARRAYEVMMENLELGDQAEVAAEEEENPGKQSPSPDGTQQDEPEYIKLWKKMLEKECNHQFLNFEEQLGSLRLDSDCTEQNDEDEQS